MAEINRISQSRIRQQFDQQKPPTYIQQSWHREQANSRDQYLVGQTFVIAPDTIVPSSCFRQHVRNIYEERLRSAIVVHYDPWTKEGLLAKRAKTASIKESSANLNLVRSHTIL